MRDPRRIERILNKIRQVWYQVPDWRLGQLIENVSRFYCNQHDAFFMEDNDLEKALENMLIQLGSVNQED